MKNYLLIVSVCLKNPSGKIIVRTQKYDIEGKYVSVNGKAVNDENDIVGTKISEAINCVLHFEEGTYLSHNWDLLTI